MYAYSPTISKSLTEQNLFDDLYVLSENEREECSRYIASLKLEEGSPVGSPLPMPSCLAKIQSQGSSGHLGVGIGIPCFCITA